jgi:hypothetical protein
VKRSNVRSFRLLRIYCHHYTALERDEHSHRKWCNSLLQLCKLRSLRLRKFSLFVQQSEMTARRLDCQPGIGTNIVHRQEVPEGVSAAWSLLSKVEELEQAQASAR